MWTAGILLVLGLAWFVGAVVVPVWQVRAMVSEMNRRYVLYEQKGYPLGTHDELDQVTRLGGPEAMLGKMRLYLRMPKSVAVHRHIAAYFMRFGGTAATEPMLQMLADPDPKVRLLVVRGLACNAMEIGDSRAVSELVKVLGDRDDSVQKEAVSWLAMLGGVFPEVGPALREVLHGCDVPGIRGASLALSKMGKAAPGFNWGVRCVWRSEQAEDLLRHASAEAAAPELEALLGHEDRTVGCIAAMSLWMVTDDGRKPLTLLLDRLRDPDANVRADAVTALCTLEERAAAAVPALQELTAAPDSQIAEMAKEAVYRCQRDLMWLDTGKDQNQRMSYLAERMKSDNWEVRANAIMQTHRFIPHGKEKLALIEKAAGDESPVVRRCADYALEVIRKDEKGE